MTPKEKAEELIEKFDGYTHYAMYAVDEILSSGVDADYYFDKSVGYMITYQEYYQEVKQEI
jgi:orotate phosphoribosyltransferase